MQNQYNLAHRDDDRLINELAEAGIAYVPFFPLGGFAPLQSTALNHVAAELGATPMQVALAWLLHRAPNVLLIPGTSSVAHLRENSRLPSSTCRGKPLSPSIGSVRPSRLPDCHQALPAVRRPGGEADPIPR